MPPQGPITVLELLGRLYRMFRWVLLAACLIVFFLILRPDRPPEVQVDENALASLESKVASMHQPAARQARELRLNEAELNGWLRSNLAVQSASAPPGSASKVAEGFAAGLDGGSSSVQCTRCESHSRRRPTSRLRALRALRQEPVSDTERQPRITDGYLRLSPTAMKLGSMPIPRATLERAVQQLFDSPENREQFRVPSRIRDIRVENSTLIIAY